MDLGRGTKIYVDNYNNGIGATLILSLNDRSDLVLDIDSYQKPKTNNKNIKNVLFNRTRYESSIDRL